MNELVDVLSNLENAGHRLRENKFELVKSEIEWIGHKTDQIGIRPLQDKLIAIKNLRKLGSGKEKNRF